MLQENSLKQSQIEEHAKKKDKDLKNITTEENNNLKMKLKEHSFDSIEELKIMNMRNKTDLIINTIIRKTIDTLHTMLIEKEQETM